MQEKHIAHVKVPGALEVPVALQAMAELVASGVWKAEGTLSQWKKQATSGILVDPTLVMVGIGRAQGGDAPIWTLDLASADDPSCD